MDTQRQQEIERGKTVDTTVLGIQLYHAEFQMVNIEPNSIDVILTDPPYPEEFLPLFDDLGFFAQEWLKPGGLLAVMVGQSYLPVIFQTLSQHLAYHWTLAYLTPGGQAVQLWQHKVNTFWKPILLFSKGDYAGEWIGDVTRSDVNHNDKRFHEWGQSFSGMVDLAKRLCKPGHVVLDPFMGAGTTGLAVHSLGCHFIGIDTEEENINITRSRLAQVEHGSS